MVFLPVDGMSGRMLPALSEIHDLVIQAVAADGLINPLEEAKPVPGHKVDSGNFPFLQVSVGIEGIADYISVAIEHLGLAKFGARRPGPQLLDLVLNLFTSIIGGIHQRLIQAGERFPDHSQGTLQSSAGPVEGGLQLGR
jgi:hypothetical protein